MRWPKMFNVFCMTNRLSLVRHREYIDSASLLAASPVLADDELFDAVEALPSGPEGPALWKVSDEDTTIYLFGTVHVLPKELVWYDAEIDAALSASDTIVTEIAMDPATEAKQQMLAQQKGVFTDGTTLRSLLSEEQKAAYEAALANLGAPANAFDPLEPWLTTLTLTNPFLSVHKLGWFKQSTYGGTKDPANNRDILKCSRTDGVWTGPVVLLL